MSLRVHVLSSGSTGNATLYSAGQVHVLVDCGLSAKTLRGLLRIAGVAPGALSAVFVSHEHTDHVRGLRVFLRSHKIPLFADEAVLNTPALAEVDACHKEALRAGEEVRLGSLSIRPFLVPHDSVSCLGFCVESRGVKAVQATDLGQPTPVVRERMRGAHCILLEFNHDIDRLMNGSYPLHIKMRVKGSRGHLSNEQAASLLAQVANGETQALYLMHMSQENNLPELALLAAREALDKRKPAMEVTRHGSPSRPWEG